MSETTSPTLFDDAPKARSTAAADLAKDFYAKFGTSAPEVRSWAQENGLEVGTRGQIKPEVLSAYGSAHEPADVAA